MSEYPVISVLMTFYNKCDYIEESIKSIINQSYPSIELIVVDDNSPDPKAESYIVELQKKYGFKLIRNNINIGASKSYLVAFDQSTGEYISILSHDDVYNLEKLSYMFNFIKDGSVDCLFCNGAYFNDDKISSAISFDDSEILEAQKTGQEDVLRVISSKDTVGCLLTQGALYKRFVWISLREERQKYLLDDWPFTILVWKKFRVKYIPFVAYYYRLHQENSHKDYYKWMPARIQTVCELVERNKRLDVIGFIFIDNAQAAITEGDYEVAIKLLTAGYFLSDSKTNINMAIDVFTKKLSKHSVTIRYRKILKLLSCQGPVYAFKRQYYRVKRRIKGIINTVRSKFNK